MHSTLRHLPLVLALAAGAPLAQAKSLAVCTEASPEGFDVVQYNSLTTTNASADVLMNRLVDFDAARGEVVPSLAESWKVSDDGLTYDFQLRDGVAFYARALTCSVGGLPATPQPGGFYGGWVTPDLAGPFKGSPGSEGW